MPVPALPFGFGCVSVAGGCVKVLEKDGNPTGLHVGGVTLNKPILAYLIEEYFHSPGVQVILSSQLTLLGTFAV